MSTTEDEIILTRASDGDRAYRLCRCAGCGVVSLCTPDNDFYNDLPGRPPDLLFCEPCTLRPASPSTPA